MLSRGVLGRVRPSLSLSRADTTRPLASSAMTASIEVVRHGELHISKPTWWLESRFHFSFADWFTSDPARQSFGALRVVNDDLVKAHSGFGAHPHRDMEIFSYIVDGELSHRDSMGNQEALPRGCVQYMSAGTGVIHSEMNEGDTTCRFIQVWVQADRRGHTPQYGSSVYDKGHRHNRLLHILGGTGAVPSWPEVHSVHSIKLHQDANVFVSESDAGKSFELQLGGSRQAYLLCIEGALDVNGTTLARHEATRVRSPYDASSPLTVTAGTEGAHFMVIELAQPA